MNGKEVNLNQLVAGQEKSLRQVLGHAITLEYLPAAEPAWVHGDEGMLGQIVLGLAANARNALPGGGLVRLEVEPVEVDEIHARVQPGARRGDFVRLTISDNGRGNPVQSLQRLFEVLPPPTGSIPDPTLPLPLIAGMVKRRRGWIEAHSHTGGGSTVHVYFPKPSLAAASKASPGMGETVLLVDDEASVRQMVRTILERANYEVIEAESGPQALRLWEEHAGMINLLLTDMIMPSAPSGRGLARHLQGVKPELKVIYTSGHDLEEAARRDTERGTACFLHKPYDMRRLLETVHVAMMGRDRVTPPALKTMRP